jgi:competence protein ComGC
LAAATIDRERHARHPRALNRCAFSLVDVLVTLAVISVLIGLLLPTLSGVRETTRQVVCRSNVRSLGLGIVLFADDHENKLPPSEYVRNLQPHRTTQVRRDSTQPWDGLGYLYSLDYLPAAGVFYCPSHTGTNPYSAYADRWTLSAAEAYPSQIDIITNYQYRGTIPGQGGTLQLRSALVTDALSTQLDFNHRVGANVLRADFSANWYPDPTIVSRLPVASDADPAAATKVNDVWDQLDIPTEGGP